MSGGQPSGADPRPSPVERVRGSRPEEETWRADALAGSRHSRWVEELRQPLDLHDREQAEEICGQVARLALQDFAPAQLLLSKPDRQRLQAVTAYALTLFDFARQSGLEGERLTAMNRWDFDLEATLDGQPVGQPVFVLIHALEQQRPWNREAFDLLHATARHRCVQIRPPDRQAAEREAHLLGKSLAWLLLPAEPDDPVAHFAAGLIRLRGLLNLGDGLRRHCASLPLSELPESWSPDHGANRQALEKAIRNEVARLESVMESREYLRLMPRDLRAAARYCQRAAQQLLRQVQEVGATLIEAPPRVGLLDRLGLLVRSRWL